MIRDNLFLNDDIDFLGNDFFDIPEIKNIQYLLSKAKGGIAFGAETKKLIALQGKIAELERVVGQKQLLIDFQSKMIELAEQEYGIDIKKNADSKPSSTSGNTGKSSNSV